MRWLKNFKTNKMFLLFQIQYKCSFVRQAINIWIPYRIYNPHNCTGRVGGKVRNGIKMKFLAFPHVANTCSPHRRNLLLIWNETLPQTHVQQENEHGWIILLSGTLTSMYTYISHIPIVPSCVQPTSWQIKTKHRETMQTAFARGPLS